MFSAINWREKTVFGMVIATALLVSTSMLNSQTIQSAVVDCSYYRQGSVEELPIALVSGWGNSLKREPTNIFLDVNYIPPPRLPRFRNGVLSETEYVEIDVETGLPPRIVHGSSYYGINRPNGWTRQHFSMLLQAHPERPIWTILGSLGGQRATKAVEIKPGIFAFPIDGYIETGRSLAGFTGIVYPEGSAHSRDRYDLFIRKDDFGEVFEILNCKKPASAIKFPSCELHIKVEPFMVKARFEKSSILKLDHIRTHATNFTSCLLKE